MVEPIPTVSPLQVLSERFNKLHKFWTALSLQEKNKLVERLMLLIGLGKSMKAKNILKELINGKSQLEEPLEKLSKEPLDEYNKPKSKVKGKLKKPNNKAKPKKSKVKAKPKKSKKSKRVKKSKAKGKASQKSKEYIRF